jgi:hypothetical protein
MKINLPLKVFLKTAFLLSCFATGGILHAQTGTTDTAINAIAIRNAVQAYHQFLSPQAGLYNGSEYVDYAYTINEGIPFFETAAFSRGIVDYDGMVYEGVPLLYDEVKEAVVIPDVSGRYKIQLNNERLAGFTLLNHHFVKLMPDSVGRSPIRPGFYDVLYDGNMKLYKKQTKAILESVTISLGLKRTIDEQSNFYIKSGNAYYKITNKRSVLNINDNHRKEVQQFIKKNKLSIRNDKENALIKIAAFYDQLTSR